MSVETKYDLKQETIETLQDLIRMNIDSAKGFREASDLLDDNLLAGKLTTIANEREQQAAVLQAAEQDAIRQALPELIVKGHVHQALAKLIAEG